MLHPIFFVIFFLLIHSLSYSKQNPSTNEAVLSQCYGLDISTETVGVKQNMDAIIAAKDQDPFMLHWSNDINSLDEGKEALISQIHMKALSQCQIEYKGYFFYSGNEPKDLNFEKNNALLMSNRTQDIHQEWDYSTLFEEGFMIEKGTKRMWSF